MSKLRAALISLMAAALLAAPAAAENVLRFTSVGVAPAHTMDPHSSVVIGELTATKQVYEGLLDIDSNLAIVPQLAVAWKVVDLTHWDFELRPDVRFQDGAPFTAGDVIFSIGRAQSKTSDFRDFVRGIAAVEAIDDLTVRFTTIEADPSLWMKLAQIAIMSRAWAEQHGVTAPADFRGAGEETYASRHANGTGPFTLEEFEPGGRYVLVRNPDWWGQTAFPHNIDRVVHTRAGDAEEAVHALLEGEIDLLVAPPYSHLDQIRNAPGIKLAQRPKLLSFYFGLDQGSAELRSSNVKGENPFHDKRVRQAMYHAIDIEALLRPLMGDLLIPAGMIIAPGVNGYAPDIDQRLPYDPDAARALLAEAGYPDGFAVTLDCPDDWGDDEILTCRGVAAQLGEIGIEVDVNFQPEVLHYAKLFGRRESDFFLDTWETQPDSERHLKRFFHSQSPDNLTGYANPRIDELIGKIEVDVVTYARDAYLEEAWRTVTNDFVYLPIRHGVSVFAMRENLDIPPDPWDVPRFRLARFRT